jgi:hypothetical protein
MTPMRILAAHTQEALQCTNGLLIWGTSSWHYLKPPRTKMIVQCTYISAGWPPSILAAAKNANRLTFSPVDRCFYSKFINTNHVKLISINFKSIQGAQAIVRFLNEAGLNDVNTLTPIHYAPSS